MRTSRWGAPCAPRFYGSPLVHPGSSRWMLSIQSNVGLVSRPWEASPPLLSLFPKRDSSLANKCFQSTNSLLEVPIRSAHIPEGSSPSLEEPGIPCYLRASWLSLELRTYIDQAHGHSALGSSGPPSGARSLGTSVAPRKERVARLARSPSDQPQAGSQKSHLDAPWPRKT